MNTLIGALANLFLLLSTTLPGRVLSALGIGWITFAGLSTVTNSLVTNTMSAWGNLPTVVYQIASLGGLTDFLGIVTASIVTRTAISILPRMGKLS